MRALILFFACAGGLYGCGCGGSDEPRDPKDASQEEIDAMREKIRDAENKAPGRSSEPTSQSGSPL